MSFHKNQANRWVKTARHQHRIGMRFMASGHGGHTDLFHERRQSMREARMELISHFEGIDSASLMMLDNATLRQHLRDSRAKAAA